jgi:hypothetical protein
MPTNLAGGTIRRKTGFPEMKLPGNRGSHGINMKRLTDALSLLNVDRCSMKTTEASPPPISVDIVTAIPAGIDELSAVAFVGDARVVEKVICQP